LGRIRGGQRAGLRDHSGSLIPEGNGIRYDFVQVAIAWGKPPV
jgi:hypothetical protein